MKWMAYDDDSPYQYFSDLPKLKEIVWEPMSDSHLEYTFQYVEEDTSDSEISDTEDDTDEGEEGIEPLFLTSSALSSSQRNHCNEKFVWDFLETVFSLMEEFVQNNPKMISEPYFQEEFEDEIRELWYLSLENMKPKASLWWKEPEIEEEFHEEVDLFLDYALNVFYQSYYPKRCMGPTYIIEPLTSEKREDIRRQIEELKNRPQPPQRSQEWYEFRYQLITASNAYKAFESQNTQNQLIYEKCCPLPFSVGGGGVGGGGTGSLGTDGKETERKPVPQVNIHSPLHWGQKYEPVSIMIYEDMYHTQVGDFGCIQHKDPRYSFLGASPDGINIDPQNERYGRMLEIKNIVNRVIDGNPKKEYWIQMQLQLEVCDLEECDFLETKFMEYENEAAYYEDRGDDGTWHGQGSDSGSESGSDIKYKGLILYFANKDGNPKYVYAPLDLSWREKSVIDSWEQEQMEIMEKDNEFVWIKTIYWKLDILSCVLVLRNRSWFQANVGEIEKLWRTVERERITGYEHRQRISKKNLSQASSHPAEEGGNRENRFQSSGSGSGSQGCLLKIHKDSGKVSVKEESRSRSGSISFFTNLQVTPSTCTSTSETKTDTEVELGTTDDTDISQESHTKMEQSKTEKKKKSGSFDHTRGGGGGGGGGCLIPIMRIQTEVLRKMSI